MEVTRRYQLSNLALGAAALAHALWTWPLERVAVLFVGAALIAFVAEAVVIAAGLLEHAVGPQIAGVPASVLVAWPAFVYGAYRLALLAVPAGVAAAALAAVLATAADVVLDPIGVEDGAWRYPPARFSEPRFRGVPWWNFAGWLAIVFATAALPTVVGVGG